MAKTKQQIAPDAPLSEAEIKAAEESAPLAEDYRLIWGTNKEWSAPTMKLDGSPCAMGTPSHVWEYRDAGGRLLMATARFNKGPKALPSVYAETPQGSRWIWHGPGDEPRPLLYLERIAADHGKPILLVEGEKTCDAAHRLFGDAFIATTWTGGAQSIHKVDWSPLKGRLVLRWPDNDHPNAKANGHKAGYNCMLGVARLLGAVGARVGPIIDVPSEWPDGWDVADDIPAGATIDTLREWLTDAKRDGDAKGYEWREPEESKRSTEQTTAETNGTPPAKKNKKDRFDTMSQPLAASMKRDIYDDEGGVDTHLAIKPLGYLGGKFFFQSIATQDIRSFASRELEKAPAYMELYPDRKFWGNYGGTDQPIWPMLGEKMMRQCMVDEGGSRPFYTPAIIRGRGCWVDEERVVFHAGDELLIRGMSCEPMQIKSRFIYERGERFLDLGRGTPLTDAEGKQLQSICHLLPWADNSALLADLLCGLIAMAPICGALDMRSHAWVSGPSGSGKAQPHTAKVLGLHGWTTMGDIQVGDYVKTPDNGYAKVLKKHPQGQQPTYRLSFTDGRTTRATADHLWKVREEGAWRLRTTEELKNRLSTLTAGQRKIAVPITQAVDMRNQHSVGTKKLPLHPYVLGVLLGDGYLGSETSKKGAGRISLTSFDSFIVDRVKKLCPEWASFFPTNSPQEFRFGDLAGYGGCARALIKDLRLLGKRSVEKFIPEDYLTASIEDRWELLRGLMDTDGTASKNGGIQFCTISPRLRDGFLSLVRSLGGAGKVQIKRPTYTHKGEKKNGQIAYSVSARLRDPRLAFALPRKVERLGLSQYAESMYLGIESIEVDEPEECSCITIDHPDRLYLTDDFIVTHNSWVVEHLVGRCLGNIALYPMANSTEPGIRAFIKSDSRPVIFDEAEGSKNQAETERRHAIVSLMRASSTNQRGMIYKGASPGQAGAIGYNIRSMFFMASIGVGLQEWADQNRCLVLNLRGPNSFRPSEQETRKQRFVTLQDKLAALPKYFDAKMLNRMVDRVIDVRETVKLFSSVLQVTLGQSGIKRISDLIGTPLAALWWLTHDEAPTKEEADMLLGRYDFSPWIKPQESREDVDLLRHLATQSIKAPLKNAQVGERTVGEAMEAAADRAPYSQIVPQDAQDLLMRHGIRYAESHLGKEGFWLASRHEGLDKLMRGSYFQEGYYGVFSSHPQAVVSTAAMRFGPGVRVGAVFLPYEAVLPSEEQISAE